MTDEYAKRAPTKPFNADLERPTTQGLLPDIEGFDVLDAGCGPGITPLLNARFRLDRIAESQPTERFREKSPETFERVSREPTFLSIRAVMTAD